MIGYNRDSEDYYHKEYMATHSAQCHRGALDKLYQGHNEKLLKKERPDLERCPRCWKGG